MICFEYRFGEEYDYWQLTELKWLHMEEDDIDYNESNLVGVDKERFISKYVSFLKKDRNYQAFVADESGIIISAIFLCIIPKLPNPNRKSESIAYLPVSIQVKNIEIKRLELSYYYL